MNAYKRPAKILSWIKNADHEFASLLRSLERHKMPFSADQIERVERILEEDGPQTISALQRLLHDCRIISAMAHRPVKLYLNSLVFVPSDESSILQGSVWVRSKERGYLQKDC